jgi:uncharacterized protein (TIGR03086 family)
MEIQSGTGATHVITDNATNGELYVRAMQRTQGYLDAVRADQWSLPTPCTAWNVKDVANHIIGENLWAAELFKGRTIGDVGSALDGDLAGDDPARAYRTSLQAATNAVSEPGAMEAVCHLSFGDYSGADYAAQLFMDSLIHGWDVAKATGQNTMLDPDLVNACLPIADLITSQFRGAGVFGDDLTDSAGDEPQARLLALAGRRP